jgi:dsRNA-specific ribonuclease
MNKGKKNIPQRGGGRPEPISMESLQQKHPVSLLGELASKRRWGAPNYILVSEKGPAHAKNFVFKVSNMSCARKNF